MTHAEIQAIIAESERLVANLRAIREEMERERAEYEQRKAAKLQQASGK